MTQSMPVLVDWLPWNHTFGGNHNFGLTLFNGGTLYIDDGKPTPTLMAETLRNMREIAPTVYFNVPTPGMQLKPVPTHGKIEVRYKGPNISPGYWRDPEATANAFDDEGYFCTGHAVRRIDEENIHAGSKFDGRIAEDFKLATGTFVSVGPLRAKIIAAGAPYVQDAVITGINAHEVGALIFPTAAVRTLAAMDPVLDVDAPLQQILQSVSVVAHFQKLVDELAHTATGSANRVARLLVMHEAASIDKGEVTDKGSVNQQAVLTHRSALVEALHADTVQPIFKPVVMEDVLYGVTMQRSICRNI